MRHKQFIPHAVYFNYHIRIISTKTSRFTAIIASLITCKLEINRMEYVKI
jgi:hypothetical protein